MAAKNRDLTGMPMEGPPWREPGEVWRQCVTWPWVWASSLARIATWSAGARGRREGWHLSRAVSFTGTRPRNAYRLGIDGAHNKRAVLVADAWHGPRPTRRTVLRHLNGDPADDRPENLRWGSLSDNAQDMTRHGRAHFAKLHDAAARRLRLALAMGETDANAARRLGVSKATISRIGIGRTWRDAGGPLRPKRGAASQRRLMVMEGQPELPGLRMRQQLPPLMKPKLRRERNAAGPVQPGLPGLI